MILGIISLVTSCCFYLAIPLGVIGVILAVLSQGSDRTLPPRAKSGLWLAVAGAALSLFLTVASVASTFSRYGVDGFIDMLRQYEQFYEGQSGQDGEISNYNDMKDWLEDYLNGKDNSRSRKIRQQEQKNKRPIAVMMSNIKSGCPQYGIEKAAVIYEAPVETRITRLMGIFEDWEDIEKIGYIRSSRDYFVYSALEHDAIGRPVR